MKKSLIAVAVAGLFAAPVAMAEVTLSGAINLGIEYHQFHFQRRDPKPDQDPAECQLLARGPGVGG